MKKFKVGLVGAGGVTELHLEGYKGDPERIAVTAICDPNEEILNHRADKYGIPAAVYESGSVHQGKRCRCRSRLHAYIAPKANCSAAAGSWHPVICGEAFLRHT